jgi:hypothetical protein
VDGLPKHAAVTGKRIFKKRWSDIWSHEGSGDDRERLMSLCYRVLETSGWEDNPDDKVRTMESFQLATIVYIDEHLPKMANWPIYVEDRNDPECMLGIEQVFDVVIAFGDGRRVRFIGTVDGLVHHMRWERAPVLDENKTAARLDAGWRAKWELSHQVTGYCLCASILFGFPITRSRITGLKIKPTGRGEDVYVVEPLVRNAETFFNWGVWLRHTIDLYEQYENNYEGAPRYTHSCNRFFRPCALIPFCGDSVAGRKEQYASMVPADKSPSERAVE